MKVGVRGMMTLPERRIGQPWGRTRASASGAVVSGGAGILPTSSDGLAMADKAINPNPSCPRVSSYPQGAAVLIGKSPALALGKSLALPSPGRSASLQSPSKASSISLFSFIGFRLT